MDIDISDKINDYMDGLKENGALRLVLAYESGEGLPYAPINWPNHGDTWKWKVGKRISRSGFWLDRFLYPPERLQKSSNKKLCFRSKLSVGQYIQTEFPNVDVNSFFASFSWKIPSEACTRAKGETTFSNIPLREEIALDTRSEFKFGIRDCKAGNKMCSLQRQASNYSLAAMDCDVCCGEPGFCRDCCCILCCKTIDWAYEGYSFIRCEGSVSNSYICGHVAHIDCALRTYMAGTVGESIGLDVEYYCRRCDKRTDLISYVTRLIQTCETLETQDDVKKILNIGMCILRGSQRTSAKRLLDRIELVMTKVELISLRYFVGL